MPLPPLGLARVACRGLITVVLLVLLLGCATGLPKIDRLPLASEAVPLSTATSLGRIASQSSPDPALSGFRLMPLGSFSLDTRVQLARRAEATLDVQYYHLASDETGRWLMRALRDAAARGVRVRLLLDDYYTTGEDELLLGLAAYRNVEIRVYNPFCCARSLGQTARYLVSLNDFRRVNHRMHNKLFIADGAMAVIGGRNVANEYYLRGAKDNFVDLDAFVVGWVIPPLQALFDRYWNSEPVYPLDAVASSALSPEELRRKFDEATVPANNPEPPALPTNDVLGYGPIADDLDGGRLGLIWADAYVFADHPDKPFDSEVGGELLETSVTYNVLGEILKAKKEVVVSSPYFVPGPRGMALIRKLRDRGIDVTVMTNSLGATDEPVVHLGYKKYRVELLKMGVNLYELSSSRVKQNKRMFLFGHSLGRLHAKLVVVDRSVSFIGSMNFDPRSATINTELGAIIKSPQLSRELIRVIDIDRLQSAYKLRLAPNGRLEWIGENEDQEMILTHEPDSSSWLRFKQLLLMPFVPEELL
ncbi:MAG TPA: phospholipase D family protein [Burkholderiaceae bacterium]|nr:phospholipase D family protein [Burkholderiaceae bacterium]